MKQNRPGSSLARGETWCRERRRPRLRVDLPWILSQTRASLPFEFHLLLSRAGRRGRLTVPASENHFEFVLLLKIR